MELESETAGDVTVITVRADRIDAPVAIRFKDQMYDQLPGAKGRVLLDLKHVRFIDSSGLGALVAAMKMTAPDRKLELAGLAQPVAKVFRLTRLDQVFTIHDDVATAMGGQRIAT